MRRLAVISDTHPGWHITPLHPGWNAQRIQPVSPTQREAGIVPHFTCESLDEVTSTLGEQDSIACLVPR